jgi:hypothetical protein
MLKRKKIFTLRSDEFQEQFPKKYVISVISIAKPKNIVFIVLTAMKRDDEALNASSLHFLSSIKRFIAMIFSEC